MDKFIRIKKTKNNIINKKGNTFSNFFVTSKFLIPLMNTYSPQFWTNNS